MKGDGRTTAERSVIEGMNAIKDGQPMTSTQAANVAKDKNIDLGTKAGKKWFKKVLGLDVEYEDMSDAGPGADEIAWSKKMEKTFVNKGGSVKKKPFGYNKGGSAKKSYGMRKGGFTSRGGMYS